MRPGFGSKGSVLTKTVGKTLSPEVANRVLRNTYFLLSLTLIFSAGMAAISMTTHFAINPFVSIIVMFGLLFATMALRNSGWGLLMAFAFTGFMGLMIGPTLNAYIHNFSNGPELVATAAGGTGVIFVALSAYVLVTKKDFSFMGGFLFVALLTAVIASFAAMFFNIPGLQVVCSAAFILIFSGFILYDTSRIVNGGQDNYIMATISLYLDILNLFLSLLQILSIFGGNRN